MALIDCPECGGQVSDRAPTCPHCGVPIADARTRSEPQDARSEPQGAAPAAATEERDGSSYEMTPDQPAEPFKLRLRGRPIPVAMILFWGGMAAGVVMRYGFPLAPDAEPGLLHRLPWLMIWAGVLWFAVTEFGALMRNRLRKRF